MGDTQNLNEDMPETQEEQDRLAGLTAKKALLTEDLPQEEKKNGPAMLTEDQ